MNARAVTLPLAVFGLACALAMPAWAVVHSESMLGSGAAVCQLSIPTIDTVVAPRANGYRNPGTTGAFVICGVLAPTHAEFKTVALALLSLDGQTHAVSCTGVNGIPGLSAQAYLTKTFDVSTGGYGLAFSAGEFGGSSTIPSSQTFTVTCNLPPQTAISYIGGSYDLDVGN